MKIAQINMMHKGSTGNIMLSIADTARSRGHQVWTFSPRYYSRWKKEEFPELPGHTYFGSSLENMVHLRLSQLTGFPGYFSWIGTRQLIKELKRIQPDVVHLHNLHNCTINLPMLFRYIKKSRTKTIWTLHDCWALTAQCPYFDMVNCEKWKTGCHHCPQAQAHTRVLLDNSKTMWKKKKKWFTGIEDLTIVTPSHWLAGLVNQSFLRDNPVKVIHNGIDLDVFYPQEDNIRAQWLKKNPDMRYALLGVAFYWDKRKGLDVFVELSKRLPKEYQIILVGTNEGTDQLLPENVISIHRTSSQQELAEIYSAADLFVNPTREETFGLVNAEALACGTPVLTFQTGGSPEVANDTCGSMVQKEDVDSLQAEIVRICTTKPYGEDACLLRAREFDMQDKFAEYTALYEEKAGY